MVDQWLYQHNSESEQLRLSHLLSWSTYYRLTFLNLTLLFEKDFLSSSKIQACLPSWQSIAFPIQLMFHGKFESQ